MASSAAQYPGSAEGLAAGNLTAAASAGGFASFLVSEVASAPAKYFGLASFAILVFLLQRLLVLKLDPREPPILSPRLPFIGHIVGLIREQSEFWVNLYHNSNGRPIATLPMLNGKVYVIWSPSLVQSALRSKNLAFEPFMLDFAKRTFNLSEKVMDLIRVPGMLPEFMDAIHAGMSPKHVQSMNVAALSYVAKRLNAIEPGKGIQVDNLYTWVRELMTLATTEALYGHENPVTSPELVSDIWVFESYITLFLLNVFPSVVAAKGDAARRRLQAALCKYYAARHDENADAAKITAVRAALLRKRGIANGEVGRLELALLHVATTNTIPTLYWLLVHVFGRPALVAELYDEVRAFADRTGGPGGPDDTATIDIARIEAACPLLVASYRETIRVTNWQTGTRRVMADTTLTDADTGVAYVLRAGTDVMMPARVPHTMGEYWGDDPAGFDPRRFLAAGAGGADARRQQKAYIPFGGGKHLCPGRAFAFAENLGLLAALVLGFDVAGLRADRPPPPEPLALGTGVVKPARLGDGWGVTVRRRQGWEQTKWKFVS